MEHTINYIIHNNLNILINHISEKEFYPIKAHPVDQRKSYLLVQEHPERWQINHTHCTKTTFFPCLIFVIDVF